MKPGTKRHAPVISPLDRLTRLNDRELYAIEAGLLSSVEALARGVTGWAEWQDMGDVVQVLRTAIADGRVRVDERAIEQAEAGLIAAWQRRRSGGRMQLDGDALQAMRDMVAIWCACLPHMTRAELADIHGRTAARVKGQVRAGAACAEVTP